MSEAIPASLTVTPVVSYLNSVITPSSNYQRVNTYVEIPAFSFVGYYYGASQIVAEYSFSASRKFSFVDYYIDNDTFCLCVRYVTIAGVVVRYKLTSSDEILFATIYVNQKIYADFVIEIWSISGETPVSSSVLRFLTSIKDIPDCACCDDVVLEAEPTLNTALWGNLRGWVPSSGDELVFDQELPTDASDVLILEDGGTILTEDGGSFILE